MSRSAPRRSPTRSSPSPRRGGTTRPATRGRSPSPPARRRRLPIAAVSAFALAAGLTAVIVVTMGNTPDDRPLEVGTPAIAGEPLPRFASADGDPAVGRPIPEVTGSDFDGTPVAIARDGRAKLIVFLAHWCSVCRQEVPAIVDWLPGAAIPDTVDLLTVNTGVDRGQPNYPPSEWLEKEGWTLPVLMDDALHSVGTAFGLSAYPYFVFVDADGNVAGRRTGALPPEALDGLVAGLGGT